MTVADDFTRYATPISLDRTVAPAALRTDCAAIDGVGAVVSTTTVTDVAVLTLPAASVCVTDTDHEPSTNVPRSHVAPDVDPDIVHTTSDSPDFDAVTATVPPTSSARTRIDGVASDVIPSDELEPESDDTATRAAGTPGAVVSISIAAFAPNDPAAPGDANVNTAPLPATSVITPPFNTNEFAPT